MKRLRLSIAQLMSFVLLIGVGVAALSASTMLWASTVFTLTLALLLIGILGAMAHRGRNRVTWAGFAIFGWAYLLALFGVWSDLNGVTVPPLLTTRFLQQAGPSVLGTEWSGLLYAGEEEIVIAGKTVRSPKHFRRIGHCLLALAFGLIGAGIGRTFASRTETPVGHAPA